MAIAPPLTLSFPGSHLHQLLEEQHDRGEGLVELEEIDVRAVMPARFSTLRVTFSGPVSMMQGSEPIEPKARMRARGFSPIATPALARAEQDGGGAVDDAGRIAGVMDMLDALDLGIALQRHRVEAELVADLGEGRLQGAERLHRRAGPHVLVLVEEGKADLVVRHRDDGVLEAARLPGLRRGDSGSSTA